MLSPRTGNRREDVLDHQAVHGAHVSSLLPLSLILDKVLGEDMGQVYDKEKLQELIRMTADQKVLENEEVKIIAGALQLANKTVEDVMTKIEDVYMLDIHTVLDFDTLAEILKHGYTRVPVYDGDKTKIVNLLNTKDLALIDPDDNTPLKTVCRFYDYQPLYVEHDMKLDAMLKEFLKGNSHMAIVQRLQNNGETDPFFENLGLVTLEDVIEEILQSEIIDETDMLTDNRRKFLRHRENNDYSVFEQEQGHKGRISQQLAYVAFQYLSTAVEPFKEQYISRNVLKQLLRQNLVVTLNPSTDNSDRNYIYRKGVECDYFVLILEGHLEVDIGKESMVFETGPFSCFGTACLDVLKDLNAVSVRDHKDLKFLPAYTPDFSLRACTNVQFLRIKRSHYLAARRATQMMTPSAADADQQEAFKREWRRATGGRDLHWAMSGVDPVPPVCKSKLDKIRESMSRRSVSKMDNALDRFESRESADVDTIKRKTLKNCKQ
nr:hypothetical protein BaRGS_005766 [Batillaria attramentaria]